MLAAKTACGPFRNNQGRKDAEEKVHIWHTYRHALMLRCRRGKNSVSFCPLCGHMSKFFSRTLCHMAMMHYKNEIIAEHREELRWVDLVLEGLLLP